jgi:hypothetical protein
MEATILDTIPEDLWVEIILSNPELTLKDVSRFCRTSRRFRQLCKNKQIWLQLLQKEANPAELEALMTTDAENAMEKLYALRLLRLLQRNDMQRAPITFRNNNEEEIQVQQRFSLAGNFRSIEIYVPYMYDRRRRDRFLKNLETITDTLFMNNVVWQYVDSHTRVIESQFPEILSHFLLFLFVDLFKKEFYYVKRDGHNARITCQQFSIEAAVLCAHCDVGYCSQECANQDWNMHSKIHK